MDRLFDQLPTAAIFFAIAIGLLATVIFFILKKLSKGQNKGASDKLLLKQLLEGFGLDVPPELNEREVPVIKSIKGP